MLQNPVWKALFPLCCVLIIDAMSWGLVIPSLGPILLNPSSNMLPADTSLHVRNLLFSLSLGLPMLFLFLGAPLLGDVSDQVGRKKALLIALFGITFSCLLSAFGVVIGSVALLLIGRCLLGFMDSSEGIAKAAIADISTEKTKISYMNIMSLCGTFGFTLAPAIGGILVNQEISPYFNYYTPFFAAAIVALLNAVLLFFLFDETFVPKTVRKFHLAKSFYTLADAFRDKRIRLLSLIFFCMQFAWGGYFQTVSILLIEEFHRTPQQVGFFLTYLSICFAVTLLFLIRILLNRFEYQTIVALGLLLVTIGSALAGLAHAEIILWLSVMPITIGVGLCYNTMLSLFSDAVDKESQGRVMGVATALFAMGWVISSVLSGLLSAVNVHLPYLFLSAVALAGFLLSLTAKRKAQ